jgi:glycosyltransferase involved in cell wall biosynthesis
MRVIYILVHIEGGTYEADVLSRRYREQVMVDYTCRNIGAAELYMLTMNAETYRVSDIVDVTAFSVGNRFMGSKTTYISNGMLCAVNQFNPDLVVFQGMGYRLARWLICKSKARFRTAFIVGGGLQEPFLNYGDFFLVENNFQKQKLLSAGIDEAGIDILPKLSPSAPVDCFSHKEFDVVNVGTFNQNKNQRILLQMAKDYTVALIGGGPLFTSIQQQISLNSQLKVFMPGNVSRLEVMSILSRAKIMVHCARSEGVPRVVFEAFACGVPVVAIRDAMPEAFEHGVQGLLVNEEELIAQATALLNNPAELHRMGVEAKKYAEQTANRENLFLVTHRMYDHIKVLGSMPNQQFYRLSVMRLQSTLATASDLLGVFVGAFKRFIKNQIQAWKRSLRI